MAFLAASRRGARELARMLALASKVWPWITKLRVGRGDYAVNHNEFVCRDGREHAVFRGRRNFHQSFLAVDGKNAVTNVKLTRRHLNFVAPGNEVVWSHVHRLAGLSGEGEKRRRLRIVRVW